MGLFNSGTHRLYYATGQEEYTSNMTFKASRYYAQQSLGIHMLPSENNDYYGVDGTGEHVGVPGVIVYRLEQPVGYDWKSPIGPAVMRTNVKGSSTLFAVNNGGKDETKAELQLAIDKQNVDRFFEPIVKSFGIELIDTVTDECKEWCRNRINQAKMVEGYTDEEGVHHAPFSYPDFENVADNIYVRMLINDTGFVTNSPSHIEGQYDTFDPYIWVYVDPTEGKTYLPMEFVNYCIRTINSQGGFRTSDTQQTGNWGVTTQPIFTKTWYMFQNANTVSTKTFNSIINGKIGGRPCVATTLNASGTTANVTLWCSDNSKIGRTYTGSQYAYYNAIESGSAQAGPWTQYTLTLTRQNSSYDSPWVLSSETVKTGSISEIRGYGNESLLAYADNNNIGFGKASNLTGTKPSTNSVETSYPTWYGNKKVLVAYVGVPLNFEFTTENYKEGINILPLSFGEDAGSGKTQEDVQGGTTEERDLDEETSEKLKIEDEGETDDGFSNIGMGSGFFHLYYTSAGNVQDVYAHIMVNDSVADIISKFYGGDLSNAIIDVYRLPFICESTDEQDIKVSAVTVQGVTGYEQHNRIHEMDFGNIVISKKFGDQRDYSPITKATIYLPFSGYHQIDIDDIIDATVNLKCRVDKMSGNGVYEVKVIREGLDAMLYNFPMSCRLEYPVSYTQRRSPLEASMAVMGGTTTAAAGMLTSIGTAVAVGSASSGAAGLIGVGAAAAGAMGTLNAMKPTFSRGGSIGDAMGWLSPMVPHIIINRPNYGEPERFEEIMGRAANTDVILGNIKGFTQIREMRLDGLDEATDEEKEEIINILRSGAIL